jgi:hypothetical protein
MKELETGPGMQFKLALLASFTTASAKITIATFIRTYSKSTSKKAALIQADILWLKKQLNNVFS